MKPSTQPGSPRTVKVAVIGSGLAGLTAAYGLSTQNGKVRTRDGELLEFEVHLFEKADQLGMDASSVSIDQGDTQKFRTDVPMRSFQGGYYPNLISLYKHLGVKFRRADFTYTFSTIAWSGLTSITLNPWLIYNGQNGTRGISFPSSILSSSRNQLWAVYTYTIPLLLLLLSYIRLLFLSIPIPPIRPHSLERFDEWMHRTTPSSWLARRMNLDYAWLQFVEEVMIPLFSAVCTATKHDIWAHPARDIIDYVWRSLFTPHYVVEGGVQNVVKLLAAPLPPSAIHLSTTITSITPDETDPSKVAVHSRVGDGPGALHSVINGFSHVIFATQANHAIPILKSYANSESVHPRQRSDVLEIVGCLSKFTYRKNVVITHTDDSLLPLNPSDRRELNLVTSSSISQDSPKAMSPNCVEPSFTMATHIISLPPSSPKKPTCTIYQTTNPIIPPEPQKIISIAYMERAVLTVEAKRAIPLLSFEEAPSWLSSWKSVIQRLRQKGHATIQGAARLQLNDKYDLTQPGIWMCGSYSYEGIPLLEGCVVSAKAVVREGVMRSEGIIGG